MKQAQDSIFTNIRRHRIEFSRHDDLMRRILCTPVIRCKLYERLGATKCMNFIPWLVNIRQLVWQVMTQKCLHADRQHSYVHCIYYVTHYTHWPMHTNKSTCHCTITDNLLFFSHGKCRELRPVQVFSTKLRVVMLYMWLAQWKTVEIKNECTNGAIKWTREAEGGGVACNSLGKSRRKPHTRLKLRNKRVLNLTQTVPPAPLADTWKTPYLWSGSYTTTSQLSLTLPTWIFKQKDN